jgi:pyruvate-formate lyase-activating enzyme
MLIRPHTLSLITTHQCTAACDHCCFHCTPKVTKAIPHERLRGLLDEAATIPSIRLVAFTGGECFLLGSVLNELIAQATGLGLITRCITNGYWATSHKAATKRAEGIAASGLKEINISTGTFHSKYVPVERIIHAALASVNAGLTTLINVEIFEGSEFQVETITENSQIRSLLAEGRLLLQRSVWIENEGDATLSHKQEHSRFNAHRIDGCKTALNVIAVTPDQDLVACCGLHMERIPDLHVGSIKDRSLKEVLAEAPDDFLKIWIHVAGPERVLEFVKSHVPEYQLPLKSVHPCETCLHLYSDPVALGVITSKYKDVEKDIVPLFLAGIAQSTIHDEVARRVLNEQRLAAIA